MNRFRTFGFTAVTFAALAVSPVHAGVCSLTCPANIFALAGAACSANVSFPSPTAVGCGVVTCDHLSGGAFGAGQTTVTCSDPSGANCSFTVTVFDASPPTIQCAADVIALTKGNPVPVNYPSPQVQDNCPGALSVCTPPAGSLFPPGTNVVTCTATDSSNFTNSCQFNVMVLFLDTVGIPTVSPLGLFLLAAGTGLAALFMLARRR